jgi:PAS domain S-box-containing protein
MIEKEETTRLNNEITAMGRRIAELERVNAELKLGQQRTARGGEKFHLLMENSGDPMLLLDKSTRCIDCNAGAAVLLAKPSREEVIGLNPLELSPPSQPDGTPSTIKAKEVVREALNRGHHRFEWAHQRHDGTDFMVEVSLTILPGEERTFFVHWHDISERVLAENKLRESEERFTGSLPEKRGPRSHHDR